MPSIERLIRCEWNDNAEGVLAELRAAASRVHEVLHQQKLRGYLKRLRSEKPSSSKKNVFLFSEFAEKELGAKRQKISDAEQRLGIKKRSEEDSEDVALAFYEALEMKSCGKVELERREDDENDFYVKEVEEL